MGLNKWKKKKSFQRGASTWVFRWEEADRRRMWEIMAPNLFSKKTQKNKTCDWTVHQGAERLRVVRRPQVLSSYNWTPSSRTLQMVSASLGSVNMEIHEPWEARFIIYFKREAFSELQIQAEDPCNKTKGVLHIYKLIFLFSTCPKKVLQL